MAGENQSGRSRKNAWNQCISSRRRRVLTGRSARGSHHPRRRALPACRCRARPPRRSRPRPPPRDSRRSGGGRRCRPATAASVGKKRARPEHRIAALALEGRHDDERAGCRVEGARSAGRSSPHRRAGMSASSTTAPSMSAGRRARPAPERRREAVGVVGIVRRSRRRGPASAARTSSGPWPVTTDDRLGPARRAPPRPRSATSGLPSTVARSLFGPPMRRDWPAASTIAATRGAPSLGRRRAPSRGCGRDTISISSPPTPSAGDVVAASPSGRRAAAPAPSRSRSPSGSARSRARRAPACRRARRGRGGCPDRPACRNASTRPPAASIAGRDHVAPSTIAEAPKTTRRSLPLRLQLGERRRRPHRASCGDARSLGRRRRAGRREPLVEEPPRLVHDGRLQRRQHRRDEADLQRPERRDRGSPAAARHRDRRVEARAAAPRRG